MSNEFRLAEGGRLIDRSRRVEFTVDGRRYEGYAGDTLASALIASGRHLVGRSFKYHRPRGVVASGVEEPNALFGTGEGATHEPNQRATMVELYGGLTARTQNRFPSVETDVGAANAMFAKMFPAGFYYKTFLYPRAAWKHVYEPIIRRAAGLGVAPSKPDEDEYEHFYFYCDVLIAGGGVAGIMAAKAAAMAGARVLLVEQNAWLGGRALIDEIEVAGGDGPARPIIDWLAEEIEALEALPNVTIRTRCQLSACEDHNYALLYERVSDHRPGGEDGAPRHRLWRVRAGKIVCAAGAHERPLVFAHNDRPGVMLAGAMRDYVALYGAAPGKRVVVYANNDDAYRTALALHGAGVEVAAVCDARPGSSGALPERAAAQGLRVLFGAGVTRAHGGKRVEAVDVAELRPSGRIGAVERVACDAVAMSGGWSPAAHLWCHSGGKLRWDETRLMFRPDAAKPPLRHDGEPAMDVVGGANGQLEWRESVSEALVAGAEAARLAGHESQAPRAPEIIDLPEGPIQAQWFTPGAGKDAVGNKHFVDFQNDVTAADVELAAREGYESVEHAKRYTTLGMATDQGKLSNVNGLAILADALRTTIPEVGTTTFRPPYTPISFAAIAGREAKGLFKPVRRSPMHEWHANMFADWEPVGDWRRPFCYRHKKESGAFEDRHEATNREILTAREKVGMLDASTLGKIIVSGPDAGAFLDLMYTNRISTLKPGRCRYALMCNDNGFLFDDGVIVRLDEDHFLCHTTSGGADRVHGWMEEWLQTEWPHLQVFTANVTEQYAQIAIAGPLARRTLDVLPGDVDLSPEALPFMGFLEGEIAGCPVRVHRISFSGELSFEIATPASYGLTLWEAIYNAGQPNGVAPYGTEALHVMRAEKGFIMIGDETDGTVTPLDLNLHWAVSTKKDDFVGMRAMKRPFLQDANRKRLVGLLTEDPSEVLPDGAHAVEDVRQGGRMKTIGHVTSTYWSPTLKRSIAMALIRRGPERMGEVLNLPLEGGKSVRAKIVDPVFYDRENERQSV